MLVKQFDNQTSLIPNVWQMEGSSHLVPFQPKRCLRSDISLMTVGLPTHPHDSKSQPDLLHEPLIHKKDAGTVCHSAPNPVKNPLKQDQLPDVIRKRGRQQSQNQYDEAYHSAPSALLRPSFESDEDERRPEIHDTLARV